MTGILLVHGAWPGPWCWDGFVERLAGQGHRVHHYVEDVGAAAARFPEPPVLVGLSLGGLVVARYLERGPARRALLLAPIPHRGTAAAVARLTVRHPTAMLKAHLSLRLRPLVATPGLVRDLFFTPHTPQPLVDRVLDRLQDESYLAFLDTAVVWGRARRNLHRRRAAPDRRRLPDRGRDRGGHGPRPDARPGLVTGRRPDRLLGPGAPGLDGAGGRLAPWGSCRPASSFPSCWSTTASGSARSPSMTRPLPGR